MGEVKKDNDSKVVVFCCENSGYKALQSVYDHEVFDGVKIIPIPCSGKIERTHILKSLEKGYDGVLILACPKDNCTFIRGSYRAEKRVDMIRDAVGRVGIAEQKIRIEFVSSVDGHKCITFLENMKSELQSGALEKDTVEST